MGNKLNTKQLSEALGVGVTTIYNWRKRGLPSEKFMKERLYDLDKVQQWREANTVKEN